MSNTCCCLARSRRRSNPDWPALLGRLACLALAALSGCAGRATTGPTLAPASIPGFTVGDAFHFSDGRVEQVAAQDEGTVGWTTETDFRFTTARNVLLPRLQWSGGGIEGWRLKLPPDALLPLAVGQHATFGAERWTLDRASGQAQAVGEAWDCHVPGTEAVATPAGGFDAFRIVCRLRQDGGTTVTTRTYLYAPAIGYYVRREDRDGENPPVVITLTDYRLAPRDLPLSVARLRAEQLQSALQKLPSGRILAWSELGYVAEVRPLRSYRDKARGFCRQYAERIAGPMARFRVTETACRSAGRWVAVPAAG
jgi:hypothetical protein